MGLKKTCVRYAKVKGGLNRCAEFKPASSVGHHPKCGNVPVKNMRSWGLLRKPGACSRSTAKRSPARKSHRRSHRRSAKR